VDVPTPPDRFVPADARSVAGDGAVGAIARAGASLFEVGAGPGVVLYVVGVAAVTTDVATLGVVAGVPGVAGNLTVETLREVTPQTGQSRPDVSLPASFSDPRGATARRDWRPVRGRRFGNPNG
jgi:hypothetical protein